jgi:phosphonate transport system substrate-binding protein
MIFRTLVFVALLIAGSALAADEQRPLLIGTTPVFLDDQTAFLSEWKSYIEQKLKRPVAFVQRRSYREISDLVMSGKIDFAWVCGYPFVREKPRMKLLAVPVFQGQPLYRSYVIVPVSDTKTRSVTDLHDKIYAYSDPDSNSGWLVLQAELKRQGIDSASFFHKTFFTWAHRKVVEAVAAGVAQGGSVDGYVWETLAVRNPKLTARTRIVEKSAQHGFPPFVARQNIPTEEFDAMQSMLVGMAGDPDGRRLLRELNLDGFEAGSDSLFNSIEKNMRLINNG